MGTLVNSMLVASALNVKGAKLFAVILAPSLGALARGVIFGPFTYFLAVMVPFIWIGNSILVLAFKFGGLRMNANKWVTLLVGAILKSGFLFLAAYL